LLFFVLWNKIERLNPVVYREGGGKK